MKSPYLRLQRSGSRLNLQTIHSSARKSIDIKRPILICRQSSKGRAESFVVKSEWVVIRQKCRELRR